MRVIEVLSNKIFQSFFSARVLQKQKVIRRVTGVSTLALLNVRRGPNGLVNEHHGLVQE